MSILTASLSVISQSTPMGCSGDSTVTCGGGSALTLVYDSTLLNADLSRKAGAAGSTSTSSASVSSAGSASAAVPSASAASSLPVGFAYASTKLVAEGATGRALVSASTTSSSMTPTFCAAYCAKLEFYLSATEYSQECYCGSALANGVSPWRADLGQREMRADLCLLL